MKPPGEKRAPIGRSRKGAQPVADLVGSLMDPILRRKAGMTIDLLASWPQIAGARLADATRPERLLWPAASGGPGRDDEFEPAVLVVACEAGAALRLQHQTSELVSRVNAFFGFAAVARIKIVQKRVRPEVRDRKPALRPLDGQDDARVEEMVARIEDPKLADALRRFARASLQRSPRGSG